MSDFRKRFCYAICAVVAMIAGLGSRRFGSQLPNFLAENAGDVFWTVLVFCGISFVIPNAKLIVRVAATIGFAYAIEISQLYQAPWINSIRQTTLGGLVLGFQFVWVDLVRYAAGAMLCAGVEVVIGMYTRERMEQEPNNVSDV